MRTSEEVMRLCTIVPFSDFLFELRLMRPVHSDFLLCLCVTVQLSLGSNQSLLSRVSPYSLAHLVTQQVWEVEILVGSCVVRGQGNVAGVD